MNTITNSLWTIASEEHYLAEVAKLVDASSSSGTILDPWGQPIGASDLKPVERGGELIGWEVVREVAGRKVLLTIING